MAAVHGCGVSVGDHGTGNVDFLFWSSGLRWFWLCAPPPAAAYCAICCPAYPAFAILAAIGLTKIIPLRFIQKGLAIATPVLAVAVLAIAIFPPDIHHAAEIRPLAVAATSVTPLSERIELYDEGQPRYDETNQMQWYGGRSCLVLLNPAELEESLRLRHTHVFIVDQDTYGTRFNSRIEHEVVARSGRLVCIRLAP